MKVGIIGCGQIAKTHIPFILSFKDKPVVAVADPNEEMLKDTADAYQIEKRFRSADEMLSGFKPDVVHILTPPQSHYALCTKIIEAGCHIFLEKPMCLDLAEAEKLAKNAASANIKLCVDHNHKFDPYMLQAKGWIESGAIGEICSLDSFYGFDLGTNPQSRYFREAYTHWAYRIPGGLYQNLIDHPLYLVLDYLPNPDRITAISSEVGVLPGGVPDELRVLMADGSRTANVSVSLGASPRFHYFNAYGTKGSLHVDFINQYAFLYKTGKGPKTVSRTLMNLSAGMKLIKATTGNIISVLRGHYTPYPGTETIIHRFYESVLKGTEPPISLNQALKVMEISDIIWRQIQYPKF